MSAALDYPRPPYPKIDAVTLRLGGGQYYAEARAKSLLVIHHTVGRSARSTLEWWRADPRRIGTAYLIDRDGTVYETFPAKYWAHHVGVAGDVELEKRTIGIELASEGPLIAKNGFLAFYNPKTGRGRLHTDPVVDLGREWRSYRYFDAYEPAQIAALLGLVDQLCDRFHIPRRCPADAWGFDERWRSFEGVVSHSHLRADKTDIHPLGPWRELKTYCRLEEIP